jgi:hypothetical protein
MLTQGIHTPVFRLAVCVFKLDLEEEENFRLAVFILAGSYGRGEILDWLCKFWWIVRKKGSIR